MSSLALSLVRYKNRIKSTDVVYKGVELHVEYKVCNDSFDHEFGTENKIDHLEVHSVKCDFTDITEMLTDSQIEELLKLINEDN